MNQCACQLKIKRKGEAALIGLLSEIDERKLFAEEVYASMFKFCTGHLHLSKPAPGRCNSPAHWGKPGAFGTILWPWSFYGFVSIKREGRWNYS